ncbi:hypothetical protein EVAR_42651_1 [Eumeta japonica]|uniref:Uncharacterized protein n=1 Tax=Eumeta variegata TaxID=151549 RepID=A0A4C1WZK3_EUMVA|nr:hypothetical protein EVAR_42651_1 [Eumeta japonica]
MQHLPDSSVPKNISKPLEQDIERPSQSQNDADFEGMSINPKCFSQNELDDLDSIAKQEHWVRRNWPLRENMEPGKQNIVQNSLVARDKINHLDRFPENLGDMSEEQGERMHQDLRVMEERYQGFWDTNMMADYCWSLIRHFPKSTHRRRALKQSFLELND